MKVFAPRLVAVLTLLYLPNFASAQTISKGTFKHIIIVIQRTGHRTTFSRARSSSNPASISSMAAIRLTKTITSLRFATLFSPSKFAVRALTEGLRVEHRADNIRCTIISPGTVATELPESSSEEATRKNLREFYKMAIPAESLAHAIAYAIEQPVEVEIGEIVVRPAAQDF